MSKHDKIAKLKEYIKNFVIKELEKDEELDEVSTTATAGIDGTGTGHYDTPHAFSSGSVGSKNPEVGGYKKVNEKLNESYTRMFIEIGKAINASKADDLNAIKDLGEEYDIGRVLYMARTNPKGLKKAVEDRVKEKKQFLTKTKKLKEVTKQEVNALRNLVKGIGNLKKEFSKATKVGDRELMKKDYNKHYETLLDAEKAMVQLMQFFKTKEMLGEGRYHDWRNDESLTPKQKVGKSVREIRDALNELDKTVKMNLKLKTELNMSSQDYWKNTHKALTKISERLVKMANKIGNLK